MKIQDLRGKLNSELEYELERTEKELFDLRFKSDTESSAKPGRIQQLRRSVAQINTLLHERTAGIRGQEPR